MTATATPPQDGDSKARQYPAAVRIPAAAMLATAWTILAMPWLLDFVPLTAFPPVVAGMAISLGIIAVACCIFFVVRGLAREQRGSHMECAVFPALTFAGVMVLIIAPVVEIIETWAGVTYLASLKDWHGIVAAIWGIILSVTLILPLQFLRRDVRSTTRLATLALLVGVPIAFALSGGPLSDPMGLLIWTSWFVLAMIALALAETHRRVLETNRALVPAVLSDEYRSAAESYEKQDGVSRVGIALAGGGYRASLFGLGAMMYVHEACATQSAQRRSVSVLTSVSGGSITNGVLAHSVMLGKGTATDIDKGSRALISHAVESGSMFSGSAILYYFGLLPLTGIFALVLTWIGMRNISWAVAWRTMAIPLGVVTLVFVLPWAVSRVSSIRFGWLDTAKDLAMYLSLTASGAWLLHFVLSRDEWRLALGWLGSILLLALAIAFVWRLRGSLIQLNFDMLLRRVTNSPILSDALPSSHHVFCATEVQFDETVFFSQDAIRSRSFSTVGTGRLPTSVAIRASAAFPGGFPPLVLGGVKGSQHATVGARAREGWYSTNHMVLVDGGVRDNLGVSWFDIAPDLDERIVVSSAANRHVLRIITKLAGANEAIALLNLINIPYNTRERMRRRTLNSELLQSPWTAASQRSAGTIVHIEDSPYDLANRVKAKAGGAGPAGTWLDRFALPDWEIDQWLAAETLWEATGAHKPLLEARADAVRAHLEAIEPSLPEPPRLTDRELLELKAASLSAPLGGSRSSGSDAEAAWSTRVQVSALIGTKLSRIRAHEAMNLIVHGYYAAMANLHLCANWPLTSGLDRNRLDALFERLSVPEHTLANERRLVTHLQTMRSRKLQSSYRILNFFGVRMPSRRGGEFVSGRAIAALGIDSRGHIEPVGAWSAPSRDDLPKELRYDILKFDGEMESRRKVFWLRVVAELKQRGLQTVAVCCRELPVPEFLAPKDFDQCDAALRSGFPGANLQPENKALVEQSFTSLFGSGDKEMNAALWDVLRAPDEASAIRRLDDFMAKYGEKEPNLRQAWQEMWPNISSYIRLAPDTRALLDEVNEFVDTARKSLKERASARGYVPREELALAAVCRDLAGVPRAWENKRSWRKRLIHLEL